MVQFIVGNKGKGKTRYLLDQANQTIKEIPGNVVYLDKSSRKMYELNNRILFYKGRYQNRSAKKKCRYHLD